jgi:hypothetical protein
VLILDRSAHRQRSHPFLAPLSCLRQVRGRSWAAGCSRAQKESGDGCDDLIQSCANDYVFLREAGVIRYRLEEAPAIRISIQLRSQKRLPHLGAMSIGILIAAEDYYLLQGTPYLAEISEGSGPASSDSRSAMKGMRFLEKSGNSLTTMPIAGKVFSSL